MVSPFPPAPRSLSFGLGGMIQTVQHGMWLLRYTLVKKKKMNTWTSAPCMQQALGDDADLATQS